jgi:hypothetical protein
MTARLQPAEARWAPQPGRILSATAEKAVPEQLQRLPAELLHLPVVVIVRNILHPLMRS